MIGRGVAYRKTEETDLCCSATVEMGVLFIGRGVAYRKTGLHGILFISTVDPLQPPRATVHPPSTSSSLHLRLFIHELLFIQPPPRATPPITVQPPLSMGSCSTTPTRGYCSSTPPPSTVHPALNGVVLFIQPSTGSYSSSPNRLDRSGSCSSRGNTTGSCSSTPSRLDRSWSCSSRGNTTGSCSSNPPPGTVHPNPPATLTIHSEAASIGFS